MKDVNREILTTMIGKEVSQELLQLFNKIERFLLERETDTISINGSIKLTINGEIGEAKIGLSFQEKQQAEGEILHNPNQTTFNYGSGN